MANRTTSLFGVMHIGSEQVSLQIIEYTSLADMRVVEKASSEVSLGEEAFKTKKINFVTIREICTLLKGYRRILSEYGVRDYRLLATTAIREAENQEYIIDQIRVKTGFSVEVVDMPQEIFFKYIALFRSVESHGLVTENEAILFVDISSGGLGLTLYEAGQLHFQQNIQIGALRTKERFHKSQRESLHFNQALSEYINSSIEPMKKTLGFRKVKYLVLSGAETGMLLKMLGRSEKVKLTFFSADELQRLHKIVEVLNIPQLMQEFGLTEQKAEVVLPTLLLYKQILTMSYVSEVVVSNDQFSDGIAISNIGQKLEDEWLDMIEDQIVSLAHAVGRKYKYEVQHSAHVENTALLLFDRLHRVHGLGKRERFLLKIAAILHDIGKYICLRQHYYYSYRLIVSSDILGFSEGEKLLIANIAYYHSTGFPVGNEQIWGILNPVQKITAAKLAAILRLADAIDRSHLQKATICDICLKGEKLFITVTSDQDISLEEWIFMEKAEFFESVFGVEALLLRREGKC